MIDSGGQKDALLDEEDKEKNTLGKEFTDLSLNAVQFASVRIVRIMMTTTDSAFLGHLGTQQLAGVSMSSSWQNCCAGFSQFTLQAITTLAAQARGAGNNKLVGEWLQTALFVALLFCIPSMVAFYNIHYIVALTMKDPQVVEYAKTFAQTMMFALPAQYCYVALNSYFSTIGVVMPATFVTCITVVSNAVFNYLFIYGYGAFGGFGFIGSPLATVTSSWLQLTIFWIYTCKIRGYHTEYWGGWSREAITWKRIKPFLALGVPTGMSAVVDSSSGAVAGMFSGWCGVQVAAGQNLLNGFFMLCYSTVSGFSTATQIRLCRYLGEGKPKSAQRILKIGSASLLTGGAIMCLVTLVFHNDVWGIWTKDPALKALCNTTLGAFMACIITAYLRFTLTVVSVSLGPKEANINFIANNIASWLIYIPLAYVMPVYWGWGLSGFWWSDWAGEAFKVAALSWAVSNVDWVQASNDARKRAAGEDTKECETQEKNAFQSIASFPSPAAKAGDADVTEPAAPLVLTQRAGEKFDGIGEGKFHRTPAKEVPQY